LDNGGNIALVGAQSANSSIGYVAIYITRSLWVAYYILQLPYSGNPYDYFGHSVALSGDGKTALVGAYGVNNYTGYAAIYRTTDLWISPYNISIIPLTYSGNINDYFGWSVSLNGDGTIALVSALQRNSVTGYAAIYRTTDSWNTYTITELAYYGSFGDSFGNSVSLNSEGNKALIGANGANNG
jgi:hypothetical protein